MDTTFAHLVWERFQQPAGTQTTHYSLWYGKFDTRDSIPVFNPLELLDSLTTAELPPQAKSATITLDSNYFPHVAWSRPIGSGKKEIYYRKWIDPIWSQTENLSGTATPSLSPFIDYDPYDGSLHVLWEEEVTGSKVQIWHRWRNTGQSWSPSFNIVSDTSSNKIARSPVMEDDFALFSQGDSSAPSDIYYNIWLPPDWAGWVNFSETPASSNYPHIAVHEWDCITTLNGIWTEGDSPGPYEVRYKSTSFGIPCLGGPQSAGESATVPRQFRLFQNSPNPFHSTTKILYHLPKTGLVTLHIYDLSGRLVRNLINGEQKGGVYNISWNGRDDIGKKVSSGVYFYRLVADTGQGREKTDTRKLVLLH